MSPDQNKNTIQKELHKDHNGSEFFWLALVGLVLVVVVGSAWYGYHSYRDQKGGQGCVDQGLSENSCGGPCDTKCGEGFECQLIDPLPGAYGTCVQEKEQNVLGWESYRNEEFGFEFQYPIFFSADTFEYEYKASGTLSLILGSGRERESDIYLSIFKFNDYRFIAFSGGVEYGYDFSRNEWWEKNAFVKTKSNPPEVSTVNGTAYEFGDGDAGNSYIAYAIPILDKGVIVQISQNSGEGLNNSVTLEQLLSTFQVVDPPGTEEQVSIFSSGSCPRPSDEHGNKFQTQTGELYELKGSQSTGYEVVLKSDGPGFQDTLTSYTISADIFGELQNFSRGSAIVIFGYVISSDSGANPPYSCVEVN